jgi:hypothetical protein
MRYAAFILFLASLEVVPAFADAVDIGAPVSAGFEYAVCNLATPNCASWLAQEFSLSAATRVDSISLGMAFGGGTFDFRLTNGLTSGATIFSSATFSNFSGPVSLGPATLGPGTYFLIAEIQQGGKGGWDSSNGVTVANGGTVSSGFFQSLDNGLDWTNQPFDCGSQCGALAPLQFEVRGTTVPEPSTLLLFLAGLAALRERCRRRK